MKVLICFSLFTSFVYAALNLNIKFTENYYGNEEVKELKVLAKEGQIIILKDQNFSNQVEMKYVKQNKNIIEFDAKIFEVINDHTAVIGEPKIITEIGKEAKLEVSDIDGNKVELSILATKN